MSKQQLHYRSRKMVASPASNNDQSSSCWNDSKTEVYMSSEAVLKDASEPQIRATDIFTIWLSTALTIETIRVSFCAAAKELPAFRVYCEEDLP